MTRAGRVVRASLEENDATHALEHAKIEVQAAHIAAEKLRAELEDEIATLRAESLARSREARVKRLERRWARADQELTDAWAAAVPHLLCPSVEPTSR